MQTILIKHCIRKKKESTLLFILSYVSCCKGWQTVTWVPNPDSCLILGASCHKNGSPSYLHIPLVTSTPGRSQQVVLKETVASQTENTGSLSYMENICQSLFIGLILYLITTGSVLMYSVFFKAIALKLLTDYENLK